MPLVVLVERRQILCRPPLPEMTDQVLTKMPALQQGNQNENEGSSKAHRGQPIRKCPGVRTSMPSLSGKLTDTWGRLFKHASMCASTVVSSSKVNFTLPTIESWHSSLQHIPKSTKVWTMLRNESPLNPLGGAKFEYDFSSLLLSEKLLEFLELFFCLFFVYYKFIANANGMPTS